MRDCILSGLVVLIVGYALRVTVKWKAVDFLRWGLGLLFIGVTVSRFVRPERVVEVVPPRTVTSCKDVSPQDLTTTLKPPKIVEFGEMPPDILRVRVNTSLMDSDCKDNVRLALVAWLVDDTTDHMTDYRIEKSNLFSPVSEQMELQMHVTEPFLRRAAPQHHVMLTLLALPARLTPSDWSKATTVNETVRSGGSVIADLGFQLRSKCLGKKACSFR